MEPSQPCNENCAPPGGIKNSNLQCKELRDKLEESRQRLKDAATYKQSQDEQIKAAEERAKAAEARSAKQLRVEKLVRNSQGTSPHNKSREVLAATAVASMPSQVLAPSGSPRILVTGATGLLGRQVMKVPSIRNS